MYDEICIFSETENLKFKTRKQFLVQILGDAD